MDEHSKLTQEIRMKLMCACSASGHAAPLCLVSSGLDETELIVTDNELEKCQGAHVMKIE